MSEPAGPSFETLKAALLRPEAYPVPVATVELAETHISAVFLAGDRAYKIKKPVDFGFLDYSTPEKRRAAAEAEVRLNLRLAPGVYLGTVPITEDAGRIRVGGAGREVERAVEMVRLPEAASLRARIGAGTLPPELLGRLARRLAEFYPRADAGPAISAAGGYEAVAAHCRENFAQLAPFVGRSLSAALLTRLERATEARLADLRPLMEARSRAGIPRDTHGDLRLEHVYWFPERPPPADLLIIDCIEFNDRFRWADPVADIAFLAMELEFYGTPELAETFTRAWFEATGDAEGRELLPFYVAYRHVVRGKVRGFQAADPHCGPERRTALLAHAKAHFLPALGHLEGPEGRPCLVLVTGLPGTGKSTLARKLEAEHGFVRVSTDRVRRELVAAAPGGEGPGGRYTPEWTAATYAACRERAAALLEEGARVVVDGTLRTDPDRAPFAELAHRLRVPFVLGTCACKPDEVRRRLAERVGDESEADWEVYRKLARSWEAPGPGLRAFHLEIPTTLGTGSAWRLLDGALAAKGVVRDERKHAAGAAWG